ncbi:MAG: response regulator transcription factor [Coriobacteriia bacterium]
MAEPSNPMLRSTVLTVLGSSLLWVWGYLVYLSPVMFPYASVQSSIGIEYAFFVTQITSAIFALLASLIGSRRQVVVRSSWFLAAALAASVSVVLIEAVLYGYLPRSLLYLAAVLDGISVPLLGIVWGTRYLLGGYGRLKTASLVLLSFLVAYGFYFAISELPLPWGVIVTGVIPLLSWLAWRTDAHARHALVNEVLPTAAPSGGATSPGEVSLGDRRYSILPWRSISLIAFAAFTANLVASFVLGRSYSATVIISGGVMVVTGIVAVVFVLHTFGRFTLSIESIYRLVLPLVMVGLLAMLLFGPAGIPAGGSLINGCGMFMQALVIIKVTESTREHGLSPLVSFGVGQGVVAFVVFAGNVGGKVLFSALGFDDRVLNLLAAAGVLVLFLMVLFLMRRAVPAAQTAEEHAPPESAEHEEPSDEIAVTRLAHERGLTPRETEVLLKLGKGRSLPYIADQLFVTTGTVKTHTIHIYRKLGVNSKQELLDLLEAEKG